MDTRFLVHNLHLEGTDIFLAQDPQLRKLKSQVYIYTSSLLNEFPFKTAGIYTLTGGRQVGKTTLLKQWMARLLAEGVHANRIAFFSGELIDDAHGLLRLIQQQLSETDSLHMRYLIVDEVTYIIAWEKAIKYAADAGLLENTILMLTGSDTVVIQEARMSFPGRRGLAAKTNFHLHPLSFREFIQLKTNVLNVQSISTGTLFDEFNNYLQHGGYLTAINDIAKQGIIHEATLITYSDWIRGDLLKHGKQEHYLREIVHAIIKRYSTQVSWNALAKDLSIEHPKTVSDYVELLASMDAVFIQNALLEDKLIQAPKKAKKIMFSDPFIYHAMRYWLSPVEHPYQEQILPMVTQSDSCGKLVESTIVTHYARYYPTYYIKAEGEVDIAYVRNKKFWPVEIKWTNQIRSKDLKQVMKYNNSIILTKSHQAGEINKVPTIPIPRALIGLC
ncbi:MAG: ATP-binding protein [Pseudomonadota bacterium]